MYRITFELNSLNESADPNIVAGLIESLCESLVGFNEMWLTEFPGSPLLYSSGVVYRAEAPSREMFWDVPRILQHGYADCEDLSAYRVAELRVKFGIPAFCRVQYEYQPDGTILYHVIVATPDGLSEDPSVILGMDEVA